RGSAPTGEGLPHRLKVPPAGMAVDGDGLVTGTPTAAQFGAQTVRVRVEDGRTGLATQSFTVTVVAQAVNRAPAVPSTPPATAVVDRTYAYDPAAADPDGDPPVRQRHSRPPA